MMRSAVILALLASAQAFHSTFLGSKAASIRSDTALCMKTIAVFGASGLTASECVYQALANGDSVVGLTRNPSNLVIPKGSGGSKAGEPLTNPNLTLIGGDVTKMSDVEKVFAAGKIDGVVVALGGKTADVGDTAMKANGVKRLSVVTSIGTGDSERQAPFFFKILMMTVRACCAFYVCLSISTHTYTKPKMYMKGLVVFFIAHTSSSPPIGCIVPGHEKDLCRQECSRKGR
jgi:NAD(P)H-binding